MKFGKRARAALKNIPHAAECLCEECNRAMFRANLLDDNQRLTTELAAYRAALVELIAVVDSSAGITAPRWAAAWETARALMKP